MSTVTYVTTANYATRLAETSNTVAQYANTVINTYFQANVSAETANTLATNAYTLAFSANSLATNAYPLALNANNLATNAYTLAFNSNNLATNAYTLAFNSNNLATNANSLATTTFVIANDAYTLAFNSNNLATNAYTLAFNSNNLATNAYTLAFSANNLATNAYTLAFSANNIANNAYPLALDANNLATSAYPLALNANNLATSAYPLALDANNLATNAYTLAFNSNNLATNAYTLAFSANNLATNAYTLAFNSNNLATNANTVANQANSFVPIVLGLQSNVNIANTTAFAANSMATNAYTLAITANVVATNASNLAIASNNLVTSLYSQAIAINSVFGNVIQSGFTSYWSNNVYGNVIYSNTGVNVGIGTNDPGANVLSVVGNVSIAGSITISGNVNFPVQTTGSLYTLGAQVSAPTPNTLRNEILLDLSKWTRKGYPMTPDSNCAFKFSQNGIYNITVNVQGIDKDGEYDTIGTLNVYTNTSNSSIGSVVYTGTNYSSFGPQTQSIMIPLEVSNYSNVYYLTVNYFRNNFPYTITSPSFIQITPITSVGIPVYRENVPQKIFQDSANGYIGINTSIPLAQLDVAGDINAAGSYYNNNRQIMTSFGNSTYLIPNVGIGTFASNALDVVGNVYVSGQLTVPYIASNLYQCTGLPVSYWTSPSTSNIQYIGNVTISNNLNIDGNITATNIFGDISGCTGSPLDTQWQNGTSNIYYTGNVVVNGNLTADRLFSNISGCTGLFTPWSNVSSGNIYYSGNVSVGSNLTALGNVSISGRLSAEQVFMVACSDENTELTITQQAVSFRSPSNWMLTKPPRAIVKKPSTSGLINVMVLVNNTPISSSNISIPQGSYSSKNSPISLTNSFIEDDSNIFVNITQSGTSSTGLKLIFYYMPI